MSPSERDAGAFSPAALTSGSSTSNVGSQSHSKRRTAGPLRVRRDLCTKPILENLAQTSCARGWRAFAPACFSAACFSTGTPFHRHALPPTCFSTGKLLHRQASPPATLFLRRRLSTSDALRRSETCSAFKCLIARRVPGRETGICSRQEVHSLTDRLRHLRRSFLE